MVRNSGSASRSRRSSGRRRYDSEQAAAAATCDKPVGPIHTAPLQRLGGKKWLQNSALFALKGTVITTARTGPPLRRGARTSGCALQSVLQKIIIELSKFIFLRNPFDCVSLHAVRSGRWAKDRCYVGSNHRVLLRNQRWHFHRPRPRRLPF
jgi:hypothetical protein